MPQAVMKCFHLHDDTYYDCNTFERGSTVVAGPHDTGWNSSDANIWVK